MAIHPLPITEAQVAALFLGGILFGVHLVSSGYCIRALILEDKRAKLVNDINWRMLAVCVILLVNGALDLSLEYFDVLRAFIFSVGTETPTEVFFDISYWVNVTKTALIIFQTLLGDAMLIYRCWIVYNGLRKVVILPIIPWLVCLAIGIWLSVVQVEFRGQSLLNMKKFAPFSVGFWASSILLNIGTTGMLSARIWKVHRSTKRYVYQDSLDRFTGNSRLLKGVMLIIIESGLLYTAIAFVSFLMAVTGSTAIYTTAHAEIQVVGISFNLIIIRASRLRNTRLRRKDNPPISPRIVPLQIMRVEEIISDIKRDDQVLSPSDEERSIGGRPREMELNTDETTSN